jgi:uncharacterized UPF0160 family protein
MFGEAAVAALLPSGGEEFASKIAVDVDGSVVRRNDEIDNGAAVDGPVKPDTLGLARLVEDCNPAWDDAAA